jgi:transposase-like protein
MYDYPQNLFEFEELFSSNEACLEYLVRLRWPDGFICPKCGERKMWQMKNGRFLCAGCRYQQYILQGTIFQDSHIGLKMWFHAMWYICSQKNGVSALGLQRVLGFGSYRTAWLMLHKLRRAMIRPQREKLSGKVEVDETYVGGFREGKRGRGAEGKRIVLVAAECKGRGIGRIRLLCVNQVNSQCLSNAVSQVIETGSTIVTDDWGGYVDLPKLGYIREIQKINGEILPRCHRAASLLKRWILGTLQGTIDPEHLQDYLDEFTFRFNRRKSNSRGLLFYRLLQYAVETEPVTYENIKLTQHMG